MMNMFRSELFRMKKRPQTWIMIALIVLAQITLYGVLVIVSLVRSDPSSVNRNIQLPQMDDTGLLLVNILGSIMATVFAASLMGNEYSWNTLRPLLARSKSRSALLGAKWLTVVLYTVILVGIGVLATVVLSVIGSLVVGVDTYLNATWIVNALEVAVRYSLAFLPLAALGFLMAVLTKSNAAGIALGIALQLLEPTIFAALKALSDTFEKVEKFGISWNVNRVTFYGNDADVSARDAWVSAGAIGVWILIFVVISFRVFNKRDVTSG